LFKTRSEAGSTTVQELELGRE
jgi:hypothetical protein